MKGSAAQFFWRKPVGRSARGPYILRTDGWWWKKCGEGRSEVLWKGRRGARARARARARTFEVSRASPSDKRVVTPNDSRLATRSAGSRAR